MKVLNIKSKQSKVLKFFKKIFKQATDKIMAIDLFEGNKKGEIMARRILMLITLALGIYVLLDLMIHKGYLKTNEQRQAHSVSEIVIQAPVIALEPTEEPERGNDTQEVKQAPQIASESLESSEEGSVEKYVKSYGGRYSAEYLASLREYCSEDTLKLVVAISVAETSMGKNTERETNWYGYFYKGNRSYDPGVDEMSRVICNGIGKYYSDVATNYERAVRYTGADNTRVWMSNVNEALASM